MPQHPTVRDVEQFWNENPLFQDELAEKVGSREWFLSLDRIQIEDVFAGDLSSLIDSSLIGKKVLEVGCGPGFLSRQIGKIDLDYVAIDISEKSLELARKGQNELGLSGHFTLGNAEQLDFADSAFDHVLSIGVLHHTPDTEKSIKEIYRVLRPGGTGTVGLYCRNWILKQRHLLRIVFPFLGFLKLGLRGRGRENIFKAKSIEEFVRMYDGQKNPIGKCYTVDEARYLFSRFQIESIQQYFFPARAFKIKLLKPIHQFLARKLGFMVMIKFSKPLQSDICKPMLDC